MSCVGTCASSSFSNEFLTSYLKMWSKNYGDRYIQNSSDHTKANYCFIIHSKWLLVKKKKKTAKTTLPRSMLRSCLQLLVSRQVQGIKGCSVLQIFSKCPPSSRILAVLATVKQVKFCVILYWSTKTTQPRPQVFSVVIFH